MFSYNKNMPESRTTPMLRPVHQVAAPGAKTTISDCILFTEASISLLISARPFVNYRTSEKFTWHFEIQTHYPPL